MLRSPQNQKIHSIDGWADVVLLPKPPKRLCRALKAAKESSQQKQMRPDRRPGKKVRRTQSPNGGTEGRNQNFGLCKRPGRKGMSAQARTNDEDSSSSQAFEGDFKNIFCNIQNFANVGC
jgi:hypothetical protein